MVENYIIFTETIFPMALRCLVFFLYLSCCFELRAQDPVVNPSNDKEKTISQIKYEFERKAAADSIAYVKEQEIKNAELMHQQTKLADQQTRIDQLKALVFGLLIWSLILITYIFYLLRKKKKIG
jgi:hypothetical protein